jgi:signal transduction histidine kinase
VAPTRRSGVQLRTTVAATAVLAVVLALAGVGIVLLLRLQLLRDIDATVRTQAQAIRVQVNRSVLTGGDVSDDLVAAIEVGATRGWIVQVLNSDGQVVEGSPRGRELSPLTTVRPAPGHQHRFEARPLGSDDRYRFVVLGGSVRGTPFWVVTGRSMEPVATSTRTLVGLLAAGSPFLLAAVALATHMFVGRTLRPVEDIRRTVAALGDRDLDRRVPVPPGEDEVSRLARTMNDMLARLQQAQRTQRQLVADASHELRSPVTAIRTTAEVALSEPGGDHALAGEVLEEAVRLERLVQDLLLLARADEHELRPLRRDVDLDDLVEREAVRAGRLHSVDVRARTVPVRMQGDPDQLRRALRNLVDNAVRHAATSVVLRLRRERGRAVVDVEDDGPGIAADERQRVFDRFVRLDASRDRSSGGSGLGLPIVRALVEAHGGRVFVVDTASGCIIRVELPVREGDADAPDQSGPRAVDAPHPPSRASR